METPAGPTSSGRETRLLVVTLVVSALLLFLLARFRFPEAAATPPVIAPPLERLATRVTYDELASIMTTVERRVNPSTLVLDILPAEAALGPDDLPARAAPALRIRDDMVLVALQAGEQLIGIGGRSDPALALVARDDVRGLAVARVPAPSAPSPTLSLASDPAPEASRYVAVVEASRGGPSVRPLFLDRLDPVADPRWTQPLAALGGTLTAQPGAFVFTLDGAFAGLVAADRGLPVLVPASLVITVANDLAEGRSRMRGDLGIKWQRLSPRLHRATGADAGVVVAGVAAGGPADGQLQPGDVVQTIDGRPLASLADARMAAAGVPPGSTATLAGLRGSEPFEITVEARPDEWADAVARAGELGLTLVAGRGRVQVERLVPGTAGELAGLLPGDVITHLDRVPLLRTATLTTAWNAAGGGRSFLLTVSRGGETLVLALERP